MFFAVYIPQVMVYPELLQICYVVIVMDDLGKLMLAKLLVNQLVFGG